ncbi:MAG: methylenetetrahydrofolate reductase C-terminal domain-containing protein [Deltaproteobacteria bacterium]|jgi:ferredoxin|nr:methylenetetrahydrofolate reductase C-terminal domain-containing protein [Deltaproteobacteria bacterium]
MIIAERKPVEEIKGFIRDKKRALLIGCRGCVTVCNAGGVKEVEILASLLRLDAKKDDVDLTVDELTLERQCDPEYIEELASLTGGKYDAILSMACSIGPQFIARRYPGEQVYPVLNTCFLGGAMAHGIWAEHCQACGNCVIHLFGGLCPIARCAKSLLNGPCGGSAGGKCEVSDQIDCVWHLIVAKHMEAGALDRLLEVDLLKDWRTSRDGGPRKITREELVKND